MLKSKKVSMDKPATRTVSTPSKTAHTPSKLHIYANKKTIERFKEGYQAHKNFSAIVAHTHKEKIENDKYHTYQLSSNRLLHFEDTDHRIQLCMPLSKRISLIKEVHDSAHESAHTGWEQTLANLRDRFYWPNMQTDMTKYVKRSNMTEARNMDFCIPWTSQPNPSKSSHSTSSAVYLHPMGRTLS
jgi:hypothetical protein